MAEISEHDMGARPGQVLRIIMATGMLALVLALFRPFVSPLL